CKAVRVTGLGEELLRLLRVVRVLVLERWLMGEVSRWERLPGNDARAPVKPFEQRLTVNGIVDCLANERVVERRYRDVEGEVVNRGGRVGAHLSRGVPLGELNLARRNLGHVNLAGTDSVEPGVVIVDK